MKRTPGENLGVLVDFHFTFYTILYRSTGRWSCSVLYFGRSALALASAFAAGQPPSFRPLKGGWAVVPDHYPAGKKTCSTRFKNLSSRSTIKAPLCVKADCGAIFYKWAEGLILLFPVEKRGLDKSVGSMIWFK